VGVVGFGAIGRRVAAIAHGYGMKVLVNSRTYPEDLPDYATWVSGEELARNSDYVSLHCPLTESNTGFINADFLKAMKSTAYLINTARGPLIDEKALTQALRNKEIAGAGLDVLCQEPPAKDNPLVALDNCVITPHVAWATIAARKRLMAIAVNNLQQFFAGQPNNVVSV